jgi:hypothetical protein
VKRPDIPKSWKDWSVSKKAVTTNNRVAVLAIILVSYAMIVPSLRCRRSATILHDELEK